MVMQIWKCKLWWSYCDGGARGWWWGKRMVVGQEEGGGSDSGGCVYHGDGRAVNGEAARSGLTSTAACCI